MTASVLITGSASGLGLAVTERFVQSGYMVGAADVAAQGRQRDRVFPLTCDVTQEESVRNAVDEMVKWAGRLDVVVTCAGIAPTGRSVSKDGIFPADIFRQTLDVNVVGTYLTAVLAAQAMAKQPPSLDGHRGVIVTVGSIAARDGQRGTSAYAASKGAVASLTGVLAHDLSIFGIRCLGIAPGTFETPMVQGLSTSGRAELERSYGFPRRPGRPEEFANLTLALVKNPYVNGTLVELDGAGRLPPG